MRIDRNAPRVVGGGVRGVRFQAEARRQFDSSGNTFTSTRRLRLLFSALLGSVAPASGLSQPLPTTLNLFGSNLYLSMIALRTESARSYESRRTKSAGTMPFRLESVLPSMMI